MLNKRSGRFGRTALIVFGILGASSANAGEPKCYNLASLQGQYAVITNYGDRVAMALVVRYYDGNGNFNGPFLINEPTAGSASGERTTVSGTQTGTYTVNCDGTGVVKRVVTLSNGTTATQTDDFIITKAEVIQNRYGYFFQGQLIATALTDAGRDPSATVPGGLFVTHTYSRLPDRQTTQP